MTRQDKPTGRLRAGVFTMPGDFDRLTEQAADIAVMVDLDGRVHGISVSPDASSIGCLDHWVERDFSEFLNVESAPKFQSCLTALRNEDASYPRGLELNHIDNAAWEFPIRYAVTPVLEAGQVLLLGRDLQPFAELQQRLVREQQAHERDQERLRGAETRFRVVLEASDTPLVVVDPNSGRINDVNAVASMILGSEPGALVGTAFAQAFGGRKRAEFFDALRAAASSEGSDSIQARVQRSGREVRLTPEYFRASGEVLLLCRIASIEERGGAGTDLAQGLISLFESSSDGIVIADGKGVIQDANEAFLALVDASHTRDVMSKSLSEFLTRGGVDLKLILENAASRGRLRNYTAQIQSVVGTRAPVEISVARISAGASETSFGFIFRDTSYREPLESPHAAGAISDEAVRSVMDLVGTASLKDLVSATTDVIEKMCIETALRLTDNNRVAAAEMLGVSRQSLYVKLNKYGMQERDPDA